MCAPLQNTHDEAHTGSWQRCLECSVRVLEEARDILSSLDQPQLKTQVLATSQMQDYLASECCTFYSITNVIVPPLLCFSAPYLFMILLFIFHSRFFISLSH